MMTIDNLNEIRVFSKLSDRIHYTMQDNKRYACFAGFIVPYSFANVLTMWCLTGFKAYSTKLNDGEVVVIDEIKKLNPLEPELQSTENSSVAYMLYQKLLVVMATWTPNHYEEIVADHLFT